MSDKTEEVEGITVALDVLLTALRASAEKRQGDRGPPISMRDSVMAIDWDATEAQRVAESIVRDPLGEAIRQAITPLGERLNQIGGMKLMEDVLYAVAELCPANRDWRIAVLDRRFDGIGGWAA